MTMALWRSLYKLQTGTWPPFLSFRPNKDVTAIHPKLDDYEDYLDKNIWVMVPITEGHPYRYNPPIFWVKPCLLSTLTAVQVNLFRRERASYLHFCKIDFACNIWEINILEMGNLK